jgi:hypothetical protein
VLSLTYADLDYLGLATAMFLCRETGICVEHAVPVPFARGFSQSDTVTGGDIRFRALGLEIELTHGPEATEIRTQFRGVRAELSVSRPRQHESVNVVIPWGAERFQFTSKQNTLPVEGIVSCRGKRYRLGDEEPAFACLDFGRGVWPYRTVWNWASASGHQDGRIVGLQLGGRWTDGTGMTENALCIDGRVTKIGDAVDFEYDRRDFMRPWTIRSRATDIVSLRFEPLELKRLWVPLLVAGANLHLCFGRFSGRIGDVVVSELFGWAEEMKARW